MKIVILGPGAIGGLLAGLLWKHGHNVVCIDKKENIDFLNAHGLKIKSKFFGNFLAKPRLSAHLTFRPDMVFITTKAPFLRKAINSIDKCLVTNVPIVPLLNGLEHLDVLRGKYGGNIISATIGCIESSSPLIGTIQHLSSNPPSVTLHKKNKANIIAGLLEGLNFDVELLKNEHQVIWRKFLRLSALAATTSASGKNIGFVRSDKKWRKILINFLKETTIVAVADGAELKWEDGMRQLDQLPARLKSSLQKDLELGKQSEFDALVGAVLRRAQKYKIICPTIQTLHNLIMEKYNLA